MPVFQLLSCTLNPVNLLLFTLACSSYSLVSIYLSLTLSCSSTLSSLLSLHPPAVHLPFSRTRRTPVSFRHPSLCASTSAEQLRLDTDAVSDARL